MLYSIPTPGVNASYFTEYINTFQALSFIDRLSDGGISRLSVMALNISPYISATIIMQIITPLVPKFRALQQGLADDRKQLKHITVFLGILLAFFQGLVVDLSFGKQGLLISNSLIYLILPAVIWTLGTGLSIYLGEKIQDYFKVNGVSLIILLNICSQSCKDLILFVNEDLMMVRAPERYMIAGFIVIITAIMFLGTLFIHNTEKQISITYINKSVSGQHASIGFFPVRLCPGGIMPILFAGTAMSILDALANFFFDEEYFVHRMLDTSNWFIIGDFLPTAGLIIYASLIVVFTFSYIEIVLNPSKIAYDIFEAGGHVVGLRPGEETISFLKTNLRKTALLGCIALMMIAVVPMVLSSTFHLNHIPFLGISMIIVVSVLEELSQKIQNELVARRYIKRQQEKGLL